MKTDLEDVLTILKAVQELDSYDQLFWRTDGEFAPVTFWLNVNDVFWWGTSDVEKLAAEDVPALLEAAKDLGDYGYLAPELYAARRRKLRPQGAMYKYLPKSTWKLFDACGPERKIGPGNTPKPESTSHED